MATEYDACTTELEEHLVDPEALELVVGAIAGALARELLVWLDHRARQRGQKRTRVDDQPS